ncbi:nitroreductase [Arenicella xantha]|uniref:Nitroreductase n=1 Tax=Arenicella xantha TaxID=644221 RepID=A0A395JHR5_9GAMM|nr:nitroreductase [Arenicella xantha]RBP49375.1 nitroreductase [Arenicella xantha]
MNLNEAIIKRRSVRAYQDKPVAPELIQKIFHEAQESPSNCNTQPWHVVVASGNARDEIEKSMVSDIMAGKTPTPHFTPGDQNLKDEYRKRQIACAISLYDAMDIKYEEKDKRQQLMLRNWQFFGAPHAAFFSMPKTMSEINAVDMGIYLQTVMLLMTANGLGSCPQGALAMYTDKVHELANIPDNHAIMFGLSFGYPDESAPINQFDVGRAELGDSVEFLT